MTEQEVSLVWAALKALLAFDLITVGAFCAFAYVLVAQRRLLIRACDDITNFLRGFRQ